MCTHIFAGNDPDTAIGPGTAQWHLSGFGNHVVGPCEDGGVFVLDSANYRIKRVQLLAEGGATASRVAGTGTKAASSSASTQGVAATSVAIGSITGFVMQPSTCDVFFTERVRPRTPAICRPRSTVAPCRASTPSADLH